MPLYDFFKGIFGEKHTDEDMNIHVHLHIDKDVKIVLDGNLTIHGDGLQIQQIEQRDAGSGDGPSVQSIPPADSDRERQQKEEEEIKEFEFNLGEDSISLPDVEFGEDVKD